MDIKQVIHDYVRSEIVQNVAVDSVTEEDSLIEAGIIDSLGIQRLLAFIETRFSIRFKDEDIVPENFESVRTIAEIIQKKLRVG